MPIKSFDSKGALQNDAPLSGESFERPISVTVKCKRSIYKKELFFHNRLNRKDNCVETDFIKDILELDGQTIQSDKIPIEIVPGYDGNVFLPTNKRDRTRFFRILNEYQVKFPSHGAFKFSPKTEHKVKGDYLRFIVINDGQKWEVILIDRWHLFATRNYVKNFREHDNGDDKRFGIESLIRKQQ